MSDIKLTRTHSLPIAKAKSIVQKAADELAAEYDLASDWDGDTLHFQRQGVDGRMQVTGSEIRLDVKLGFLLKAFRGRLLEHIERHLDQALSRSDNAGGKAAKKTRRV
ncbi:MAG: polyhydroxyalkanoic acid system family protein [Burkholderiaceae bacterium]